MLASASLDGCAASSNEYMKDNCIKTVSRSGTGDKVTNKDINAIFRTDAVIVGTGGWCNLAVPESRIK